MLVQGLSSVEARYTLITAMDLKSTVVRFLLPLRQINMYSQIITGMSKIHNLLAILIFLVALPCAKAAEPDWRPYEQLLASHTRSGISYGVSLTQVDYVAISNNPAWPRVLASIEDFPTTQLANRQEQLSYYINAYNIMAIKMVLDHWPLESIKDAGNFFRPVWKQTIGKINGKSVSLHEIEHEILRPMGDPRIHMAIVCASVSCPDLRSEAYTSTKLERQMDEQSKHFLSNSNKGVRIEENTLHVSKIFHWFEDDFRAQGGVEKFIKRYRRDLPDVLELKANLPYDWSLNTTGEK